MRILLSVVLLLLFLPSWSGDERLPLLPERAHMRADPVTLHRDDAKRLRIGGLTFLGGVRLTSPATAFGGFSAMMVAGDQFTLLSDGGNIVSFRMGEDWQPRDLRFANLPDGPGRGWHKADRDSESLTVDAATGRLWVAFEDSNEIWRYAPGFARAEARHAPAAMREWPESSGAESMVRLRDGSFVLLSEGEAGAAKGTRQGLWFAGDPVRRPQRGFRFDYRPPGGFRPTDIAELPDGRLAVLNRKVSLREGFTAAVTIVGRRSVRSGRIVSGREVARFAAPALHDNFEALAATREGRDTVLWIASDDNRSPFQQSLLLKFRLDI